MPSPPTLADLARAGHDLATWCPRCQGFGAVLRPEDLAARLGSDAVSVPAVAARLRCGRCGGTGAELRLVLRDARMGLR
jgi:hypothetical protein